MNKYKKNKEPYIYCLFSSADREKALNVLQKLDEKGYRFTFEEKKWKDAISRSSLVLLFVSPAVPSDDTLRDQINCAMQENKNIISMYLEKTTLTPGLAMSLNRTQGILRYMLDSDEAFVESLLNSPTLQQMSLCPQQQAASKKTMRNTIIGGVSAAVLLAVLLITGFFSNIFPTSPLWATGLRGNMNEIIQVYLYGTELSDADYEIAHFTFHEVREVNVVEISSGAYDYGEITDVSAFAQLKNIEELCLVGNHIANIQPLLKLEKIRLLDVSGNKGVDISGISELQTLEVLNLAETGITDYSEILKLANLKELYVSHDTFEQAVKQVGDRVIVYEILTPAASFEELKAALESNHTIEIKIVDSIIIPEEETLTVRSGLHLGGAGIWPTDEEMIIDNYGTIVLNGTWEMGLCTRNNYGTVIVNEGGLYSGGQCYSINYGSFIIEKGGRIDMERAHEFELEGGTFENNGDMHFTEMSKFRIKSGYLINNGRIYYENAWNGLEFNSNNYTNNGKCYYIASDDETQQEWTETTIEDLNNHYNRPEGAY